MLCWVYSPSWARTWVLLVGVRFSSFSWHIFPESGPFVVHHRPIWDPAVNLCLLDPLLANHLGSQDHQHEYISLHALNLLCPGLEPATAPLALAEDCVMRVNWACHPPVFTRQGPARDRPCLGHSSRILGLSAATNPKYRTCFCSGQATCILIY